MKLDLIRHLWGVETDFIATMPNWVSFGYAGIELGANMMNDELSTAAQKHGLYQIAQAYSADFSHNPDVGVHLSNLEEQVVKAVQFGAKSVNVHPGMDHWDFATGCTFFKGALDQSQKHGIQLTFETHRSRALFTPWNTAAYLREFSDMLLTLDLSHWTNVCERMPNDRIADIDLACQRVGHLHARVGFSQGPQVTDFRASEFQHELAWHEEQWDKVWAFQREAGLEVSTLCPEFGPFPYMHTLPYTNQPVINLNTLCNAMAERQRDRFAATNHKS